MKHYTAKTLLHDLRVLAGLARNRRKDSPKRFLAEHIAQFNSQPLSKREQQVLRATLATERRVSR